MKQAFMAALCAALLVSCSTPARVTPRPDVRPVRESNAETRRHIKSTQEHIELTGAGIDNADLLLSKLLNE